MLKIYFLFLYSGTLRPPFPTPPHIPPPPVLPHKSHMFVEFAVTADMSPQGHILIYYIREDGETVADSAEFDVEKCFANQVSDVSLIVGIGSNPFMPVAPKTA